ncbi:MAG: hypothetical protein ACRDCF_01415 [Mycoplasmoidaceae bacterium]
MKKSIIIAISSLSVLLAASTVTAITVPLVMQAKESNISNDIKNNTIKKVEIKKSDSLSKILTSATEEEMIKEVKEINQNKSWDSIFTFTNENGKELTNIVNEVIFNLDTNPSIPQAVFAINYNEGIKSTGDSNIIKTNIESFVKRTDDFDKKIEDISNQLIALLKKEITAEGKQAIYKEWGTNVPIEITKGVIDLFEFQTEDTWDKIVKEIIVTPKEYEVGQKIPDLEIKVNLNSNYISYSEIEKLLKFNIPVNHFIDLYISKSSDYEEKLANATNVLIDLLKGDFYEQEAEYKKWNNKSAPIEFKEAIKGILSFNKSKNLNWDDIVKDITLTTGTFPNKPLQAIPNVGVQIILNDAYSSYDRELLTFDCNALGNSNRINVDVTRDEAKIDEAEQVLIDALNAKTTYTQKKREYDGWMENGLPSKFESLIKEAFTFSRGLNWDSIGANIFLTKAKFNNPGEPVPYINIKINLGDEYNSIDPNSLNVVLDGLGNTEKVIIPPGIMDKDIMKAGHDILVNILNSANDTKHQQEIYTNLDRNQNIAEFKEAIKGIMDIKDHDDHINWNDAVYWIEIVPDKKALIQGLPIPPVSIQAHLYNGYTYGNETQATYISFPIPFEINAK